MRQQRMKLHIFVSVNVAIFSHLWLAPKTSPTLSLAALGIE